MLFNDRVRKYQNKFNDTEDMIIEYIIENKFEVVNLTVKELSNKIFVAPNSIMRLCKKLDYEGFSQLKILLKEEINNKNIQTKKGLENDIEKTIDLIDYKTIEKVIHLINKSKTIVIYGIGQNSLVAEIFYKELKSIFDNLTFFTQRHELLHKVKTLNNNDTLFLISQSGETYELLEIAKEAKLRSCKIVALTNFSKNNLQDIADISMYCYSEIITLNGYEVQNNVSFIIVLRAIFERSLLLCKNKQLL